MLSANVLELIILKEPTLNFNSPDLEKFENSLNKVISYSKKIVSQTEEEVKLHKKFLKINLKKNFFN